MSSALERHHELLGEDEPPHDLVLGAPALLGIFFALALICAVCFGFGYSSSSAHAWHVPGQSTAGRPLAMQGAQAPKPEPQPLGGTGVSEDPATTPMPEANSFGPSEDVRSKPAPGVSLVPRSTPSMENAAGMVAEAGSDPARRASAPAQRLGSEKDATPRTAIPAGNAPPTAPQELPAMAASSYAAGTAGAVARQASLMVQIAAVTRAADAETLASALRHDGFAAMVRTSTTDSFFHVQVGPFVTLDAARTMRARLADGGYNAFIKP